MGCNIPQKFIVLVFIKINFLLFQSPGELNFIRLNYFAQNHPFFREKPNVNSIQGLTTFLKDFFLRFSY
jgi:hypothetical protein